MRFGILIASLLAATAIAAPASAVTNFTSTFDGIVVVGDEDIVGTIDGWTGGPNGIRVRTGTTFGEAYSPLNFVELDTTQNSSMSRTIDAGIYTLTYLYSPRPGNAEGSNGIEVYLGGVFGDGLTGDGVDLEGSDWSEITYSFTVYAPTLLTFAAAGVSDTMGGYLDNVELVGTALPVPEASEWAMLVAGLGVVGAVARRRRSNV